MIRTQFVMEIFAQFECPGGDLIEAGILVIKIFGIVVPNHGGA